MQDVGRQEPDDGAAETPQENPWRRLHPTSLFFGIGGLAKRLLLPGLIILIAILFGASRGSRLEIVLMIFFIPAIIFQVISYFTLRYRVSDEELIIRRGLIFRSERNIPLRKVQNIDLVQGPLHRLFRVAGVKIDTAGSAEAEAQLDVLTLEAVEELRGRVFTRDRAAEISASQQLDGSSHESQAADQPGDRPSAETPPPQYADAIVILRLGPGEVIRLGMISWRGLVLVAVVLGLIWQTGLFEESMVSDVLRSWFTEEHDALPGWMWLTGGLGAILLLMALSIAWAVLRFHDFTLERRGNDLRIRTGLLTKISATVPRHRIQLLSVGETVLHRLFRRVSIRIETAGGKKGDEAHDSISERWIVPILPRAQLQRVLHELQPGLTFEQLDWQGVAPRAMRRMLIKAVIAGIVVGATGLILWRPWGALAIVPISLWFCWMAWRERRFMACALSEFGMHFRSGALTRRMSAARYEKLQVVGVSSSPFDRRHRHATLRADTAGAGPAGHRMEMPYIAADIAARTMDALFEKIQTTRYRWE